MVPPMAGRKTCCHDGGPTVNRRTSSLAATRSPYRLANRLTPALSGGSGVVVEPKQSHASMPKSSCM